MQGALTGCLTRDAPPITLKNRLASRSACQPSLPPPPPGILLYKNPLVTVFTSKFHRSARARCPEGRPSVEGRKEQRTIIISLIFLPHREKAATWTRRTRPRRNNCNHAERVPSSWQLCHEVQSTFSGGLPYYGPLVKDKRERRIHNLIICFIAHLYFAARGEPRHLTARL